MQYTISIRSAYTFVICSNEKQDTLSLNENRKRKQRNNIYVATVALGSTMYVMRSFFVHTHAQTHRHIHLFCARLLFVVVVAVVLYLFVSTFFHFFNAFFAFFHIHTCTGREKSPLPHSSFAPVQRSAVREQRLTPSNTRLFLCSMCASVFTM